MDKIYQHFREHEHPFVDQVLSWKNHVEEKYDIVLTDFLDPREQQIAQLILGKNSDVYVHALYGGIGEIERKRLIIAPFYESITNEMYDIALLEASYPSKFVKLEHRDVLGTLMSLGMERKKTGDIFVEDNHIYIVTTGDMVEYIQLNLTKIKHATVQLKEIQWTSEKKRTDQWEVADYVLSSLRLDVYLKEVYKISRSKAADYIKGNLVKVNHTDVHNPAIQLIENDMVSVRGHGRSKLMSVNGKTRKGNTVLSIAKLKI